MSRPRSRISGSWFSSFLFLSFIAVRSPAIEVANTADSGPGSLRQCIADADPGATVTFHPSLNGQTITLGGSQLAVDKDLAIDASSLPDGVRIDGNHASRVIGIAGGGHTLTLDSLTLTRGIVEGDPGSDPEGGRGAALYAPAGTSVLVRRSTINANVASAGGAVSASTLTVEDCVFSGNTGGDGAALACDGFATVLGCTVTGTSVMDEAGYAICLEGLGFYIARSTVSANNCGGIWSNCPGTIDDSVISSNVVGAPLSSGGGISSFRPVTVNRSTLSDNFAFMGGAIANSSRLTLNNCTVAGNRSTQWAGGIVSWAFSELVLNHSTVSANSTSLSGGGIYNFSEFDQQITTVLNNSIVAGNDAPTDPDLRVLISAENGHNLIGVDPQLAPLAGYGGPTPTMPPLPGSPALDAGELIPGLATDQHGMPRVTGQAPDIGAVEVAVTSVAPAFASRGVPVDIALDWEVPPGATSQLFFGSDPAALDSRGTQDPPYDLGGLDASATYYWRVDAGLADTAVTGAMYVFTPRTELVVDTALDQDDSPAGDRTSLREAVRLAVPGELVQFDPAVFEGEPGPAVKLDLGALTISTSVTIDASPVQGGVTIDAHGARWPNRAFEIVAANQAPAVLMRSLGITGGMASSVPAPASPTAGRGGAILVHEGATLSLEDSTVHANRASVAGGAVHNLGTLEIDRTTVAENSAASGGGLSNEGSALVRRSTFSGNVAGSSGGGIWNAGTIDIENSTLAHNGLGATGTGGGGIYIRWSSSARLHHVTVTGNGSPTTGGGIASDGSVILANSIVAGNSAPAEPDFYGRITSDNGNNVIATAPLLVPLADYGGPTQTMPPLPGSPAIGSLAAAAPAADQRGLPRHGPPDRGATEFQGVADLQLFWPTDSDGDGWAFGTEYALGTDPLAVDNDSPRNPVLQTDDSGRPTFAFGRNPDAVPGTVWTVYRSSDLAGFEQVFRFDGVTAEVALGYFSSVGRDAVSVTSLTPAPENGRTFYLLSTELEP